MNKRSNITINWWGKENKRGLTETTLETLIRVGEKIQKNGRKTDALDKFVELKDDYEKLWMNADQKRRSIAFADELKMVNKYVNVRL